MGGRHQGNTASYDPASGRPYLTSTRFDDPAEAVRLIRAAELLGVSVAEVLRRAVRHMPTDDDGRPVWPDGADGAQLELLPQPDLGRKERVKPAA
jgi:hypothetical protein